jgi:hypothetical protein
MRMENFHHCAMRNRGHSFLLDEKWKTFTIVRWEIENFCCCELLSFEHGNGELSSSWD